MARLPRTASPAEKPRPSSARPASGPAGPGPGGARPDRSGPCRPPAGPRLRAPAPAGPGACGPRPGPGLGQESPAGLGTELGRRADQPRSVHLVGVSVGAFVADAIAKSYASTAGASKANVHLTLCDAFTARGLAGLARPATAYGVATFGSSADYCESILNTDDPVPPSRTGDVPRSPLTPRL